MHRSRFRSRVGGGLRAALDLQFTGGSLDSRVTFTRASPATRFSSSGLLETGGNNVARFDYDPSTLAARGLLIEEQRTNLLLRSQELDNAAWVQVGTTVAANAQTSPDGTVNADTISVPGVAGGFYQLLAVTASTTYSISWWVKLGTMAAADYKFAVYDASIGNFFVSDAAPSTAPTSSGWTRITSTFTTPVGCTSLRFYPYRNSAVVTGTAHVWGVQLEAGASATSYVPTTSAQVTRSADLSTMTGANFSSWYNAAEGTLLVEYAVEGVGTAAGNQQCAAAVGDGTASEVIFIGRRTATNATRGQVADGGAVQADINGATVQAVGTYFKAAIAYRVNDFELAVNGASVGTDTSGTIPTVDRLLIGRLLDGNSMLNGWVKRVAYYPTRLSSAQLAALTA